MKELTIEEINLLVNLMSTVKNGEVKFTLEEIIESPFYDTAFYKLRDIVNDFMKDRSI